MTKRFLLTLLKRVFDRDETDRGAKRVRKHLPLVLSGRMKYLCIIPGEENEEEGVYCTKSRRDKLLWSDALV